MSAHDLAPVNSILGIIYGILGLLNVSNSLAHIPSGACLILALIDAQQSLMHVLSNSIPSESGKDSSLVQSDWLSLLITLLLAFSSFGHGLTSPGETNQPSRIRNRKSKTAVSNEF